jgi:hypothetical protein
MGRGGSDARRAPTPTEHDGAHDGPGAQTAPFVAALEVEERTALWDRALELLGQPPPLVRSVLVLSTVVP